MNMSVVIPTYNSLERLQLTLEGLERQTCPKSEFEVVIVDDGSTDGTGGYLDRYSGALDLKVIHQANTGQAKARNRGILKATGETVMFIDDDVYCLPDFIERHQEHHRRAAGPALIVGTIHNVAAHLFAEARETFLNAADKRGDLFSPFCREDHYLQIRKRIWEKDYRHVKWICFTAANASIPRELIMKTGMFDENFSGWGPEDIELGYRLFKCGLPFVYDHRIVNYHFDKQKSGPVFYANLAGNLRYMKEEKHRSAREIHSYILFIGGHTSLEEFNHVCSGAAGAFEPPPNEELFYFKFLSYFKNKSEPTMMGMVRET